MHNTLFPATREIVTAAPSDFNFVTALARRYSNNLGFIPDAGLHVYLDRGEVTLAIENDEPAGFLLGRAHFRWQPLMRPITQAAICYDAQRQHHGLALVHRVANAALIANQVALQAICRSELDANKFWKAAGFLSIGTLHPWTTRQKSLIVWRRLLTTNRPLWFDFMPPVAGYHAARTT